MASTNSGSLRSTRSSKDSGRVSTGADPVRRSKRQKGCGDTPTVFKIESRRMVHTVGAASRITQIYGKLKVCTYDTLQLQCEYDAGALLSSVHGISWRLVCRDVGSRVRVRGARSRCAFVVRDSFRKNSKS